MDRLPYEKIVMKAMELFDKAVLCDDPVLQKTLFSNYTKYLASCGWTDMEFDAELLKHIDQNWNDRTTN
jgi:peptide methionine sulfoxide reductase MsrB